MFNNAQKQVMEIQMLKSLYYYSGIVGIDSCLLFLILLIKSRRYHLYLSEFNFQSKLFFVGGKLSMFFFAFFSDCWSLSYLWNIKYDWGFFVDWAKRRVWTQKERTRLLSRRECIIKTKTKIKTQFWQFIEGRPRTQKIQTKK